MDWLEEHKKFLIKWVLSNEKELSLLKQKYTSNWDDDSKANYNQTKQRLEFNIEYNYKTIRSIDESRNS